MSTINTLLTIGAVVLLSYLSMSFNDSTTENEDTLLLNRAITGATNASIALLAEMESKAFDERTIGKTVTKADSLSTSLGPDGSESNVLLFDDIDDFNNHQRTVNIPNLGDCKFRVKVAYCSNPTSPSVASKTFSKKIDMFVTGYVLPDTLKISKIVSY